MHLKKMNELQNIDNVIIEKNIRRENFGFRFDGLTSGRIIEVGTMSWREP